MKATATTKKSNLRRGGVRKHNFLVMFDNKVNEIPSTYGEPLSVDEIATIKQTRWYQRDDYRRFKKDTVLNSLNYINARRASKPFDETKNSIRGIEGMCMQDKALRQRYASERKYIYKVIRDEQARQKKELRQKQEQQNQTTIKEKTQRRSASSPAAASFPDWEKLRSVIVLHTKGARDRALARGTEYEKYARAQRRSLGLAKTSSMKNLFKAACRTQSASIVS